MTLLELDLENCYGITRLQHTFDFSRRRAFAIYAPNGTMKSSLAQTFSDVANGVPSRDRVFADRVTRRLITADSVAGLGPTNIVVVPPYDEYFKTEKTSTLLVDAKLRSEYESLLLKVDEARETLLADLGAQSASRMDMREELLKAFVGQEPDVDAVLLGLEPSVISMERSSLEEIPYNAVFDPKVLSLLENNTVKEALSEYIDRFNALLAESQYFRKDGLQLL